MKAEERQQRIAEDVGMCYAVRSDKNAITILCDLLYYTTLRSRWHKDAVSAIQGVCPEYFEEPPKDKPDTCDKKKCGQCGYFMRYSGWMEHCGDCASIGMNKECNEGGNPFNDPDETILQVEESDDACGFFRANRTRRVRQYMKDHSNDYVKP